MRHGLKKGGHYRENERVKGTDVEVNTSRGEIRDYMTMLRVYKDTLER